MHSKENVEFTHETQPHSYGEKPLTVREYIARQTVEVRPELHQVRDVLRATLPDAEEKISWGMPTYWQGRNLIHFAANKHHIGLYPGAEAVAHFAGELDGTYTYSKGSIRIPYGKVDVGLIARIAAWCLGGVEAR